MSDFSIRSDSVDVEQIMRQIRARIRDKRGVDYTEQQIQELATAKLDRFLDPTGVRSGLLEQYRQRRAAAEPPPMYAFEDTTLFESDKAIVRFIRRLLKPVLKLFFNYNTLIQTLHTQAAFNRHAVSLHENDPVFYELVHNLVVELTRVSIEAKNLKMRVESLQSRLEFNERRARALEAVVQYKEGGDRRGAQAERRPAQGGQGGGRPDGADRNRGASNQGAGRQGARPAAPPPQPAAPVESRPAVQATSDTSPAEAATEPQGGVDPITGGESLPTRRRRRRRRRGAGAAAGAAGPAAESGGTEAAPDEALDVDDGEDDGEGVETEASIGAPAAPQEPPEQQPRRTGPTDASAEADPHPTHAGPAESSAVPDAAATDSGTRPGEPPARDDQ